jgi:catechol 2,3-dioxygenase-like lactoylglutathione lyase family enzyme
MTASDPSMPTLAATVLQSPEPLALARFYGELTGWTVYEDDPTWARIRPDDGAGLSVQYDADWEPPVWPSTADAPRMEMHLDFQVEDLDAAVARAEGFGARQADFQPQDDVRVMLDPDGHVFCLFLPGA